MGPADKDDKLEKQKKKKTPPGEGPKARRPTGPGSVSPSAIGTCKLTKEVQAMEKVLLACEHTLQSAADVCTLKSLTVKTVDDTIGKTKGRMTPPLVQLYMKDFDSVSEPSGGVSKGWECLDKVKHVAKKLGLLRPVVEALQDLKKNGHMCKVAIDAAKAGGAVFAKKVDELIVKRNVHHALAAKEWAR